MRKLKKSYKRPQKMWNKARIERDKALKRDFGLVREREIWRAETVLRKYRRLARELVATRDKEKEKELVDKLAKMGILKKNSSLDDVLGLTVETVLERRFQTMVFKLGLANTPKQARQLIAHGHVTIGGRVSKFPSRMILKEEEKKIQVIKKAPSSNPKKPAKVKEYSESGADKMNENPETVSETKVEVVERKE